MEKDAARAYDKVASILGRPLNFPNSKSVVIEGQTSEGADERVVEAVKAAKTLVASGGSAARAADAVNTAQKCVASGSKTGGTSRTSTYTGTSKSNRPVSNPWQSSITVSSNIEKPLMQQS